MTQTTRTTNPSFDQWLSYYTDRFAKMADDGLKGYWWLYGRDSEESASPQELAAWAAVNAEMQARQL